VDSNVTHPSSPRFKYCGRNPPATLFSTLRHSFSTIRHPASRDSRRSKTALSATYRGKIRSWTRSRHSRSPIGRGPARQVSKAARSACSRPAKSYFFPICASSSATRRPTAGPPLLGWQGQEHQFRSRRRRAAGHVAHERGRRCASATSAAFLPPMPYPPEWALPGLRALAPAGPRELPAGAGRSAVDLLPER